MQTSLQVGRTTNEVNIWGRGNATDHTVKEAPLLKLALPQKVQESEEMLDLLMWPPKEELHDAHQTRDSLAFNMCFFMKKNSFSLALNSKQRKIDMREGTQEIFFQI